MPRVSPRFSIVLSPELAEELERRRDSDTITNETPTITLSQAFRRLLERTLDNYRRSRSNLRRQFSDSEIGLILDVAIGYFMPVDFSASKIDEIVQEVILFNPLEEKWGVNGPALVKKLRNLHYADKTALIDAIEVWLIRSSKGEHLDYTEVLKEIKPPTTMILSPSDKDEK